MGTIKPSYIENIALLAIDTAFPGLATREIELDFKDIANGPADIITPTICWAPGASPASGKAILVEVFAAPSGTITDHETRANQAEISIRPFSDVVGNSTVDADSNSGQNVLNVAATTNFAVGDTIIISPFTSGRREFGKVASISAGVSLTLVDNLTYTHTAVQADEVKKWQKRSIPVVAGGKSTCVMIITNEDTDGTDNSIIEVKGSMQAGYVTA